MADAGIGGDDAGAFDLAVEPGRADEIAAKQDGECAHIPWPLPARHGKRKAGKLPLAWFVGRAYVSKRSNGVPDAIFADRLRGTLANPLNLIRFVPAEGLDVSDSPTPQFL